MSRAKSPVFAALALLVALRVDAQQYTYRHFAGSPGGASYEDGTGAAARFNRPSSVAVDAAGNAYVADTGNHTIRKVSPSGEVTTLAGLAGESGAVDGTGATARFRQPRGVVLDETGNVFVADTGNHVIRKVSPSGVVSTFAGVLGVSGTADGPAEAARFQGLRGLARDTSGNLYVADTLNHTVRKVSFEGAVTTLAGFPGSVGTSDGTGGEARFQLPTAVGVDGAGNVYVADSANQTIRRVTQAGVVTTYAGEPGTMGSDDGPAPFAHFSSPSGVVADADGTVWVADTGNHSVRRISAQGVVATVAGVSGRSGTADGAGNIARLLLPGAVAIAAFGVVVADTGNHTLRRVAYGGTTSTVTTLAGSGLNTGSADGVGAAAQFNGPAAIALDSSNAIYVADEVTHIIRKVASDGAVTTIAGLAGTPGLNDGLGPAARFRGPAGIAVDGAGTVYVADTGNHAIRKVAPNGAVTLLAGQPGVPGTADGTGTAARFSSPHGMVVDSSGNLYVADTGNHAIRKVTQAGVVTTFAGQAGTRGSTDATGTAARFGSPEGLLLTAAGVFYVADTGNSTIRRMTAAAEVTTVAGSPGRNGSVDAAGSDARFDEPRGIAIEAGGTLIVADSRNQALRRVRGSGVITIAGLAGAPASTPGTGVEARFDDPRNVLIDSTGRLIVLDTANHALKRGGPVLQDRARIDAEVGPVGQERQLDTIPRTAGSIVEWSVVRRPSGSHAELSNPLSTNPRFAPDVADLYVIRLLATLQTAATISSVQIAACGSAPPPPVITRTAGRVPSCAGEPVTLDAGAGYQSYLWSTGEATRTITVSPAATTTYSVTVTSEVACGPATSSLTQTVAPPLTAVTIALGGTPGLCANAAGLTASATSTGGGLVSHQWGFRVSSGGGVTPIAGETSATYTIDAADFPAAGRYLLVVTATPSCGAALVSNEVEIEVAPGQSTRLVPIVLDVDTGSAHFTTELALTNRSAGSGLLAITYTAALGTREGSGTVMQSLAGGQQLVIPDVLAYLRGKGLAIPPSSGVPQQGGTLLVDFGALPADAVAATARTTAATSDPQPAGAAGLAYSGVGPCEATAGSTVLHGLVSTAEDRSNVAVYNPTGEPVTVRISVTAGDGSGRTVVVRQGESMPPYGWLQVSRILDGTGISSGWATVERVSQTGAFGAYAVLNDNLTNDGSFVVSAAPASGVPASDTLVVPVLVEIRDPRFSSELFLANRAATPATFTLSYRESLSPSLGEGATLSLTLAAGEQRVFSEVLDYLRTFAGGLGARGAADYAGALFVQVSGAALTDVYAGARTSAFSPAGGRFGLFTPGLAPHELASDVAWLHGLAADAVKRSNVAVVNAGGPSAGAVVLELVAFDGDAGGVARAPVTVGLNPGQWTQLGGFLRSSGVANGWVRVRRISGSAPWLAYGVVNDGGQPGQRTGDGAYVPMAR